MSIWVYHLIKCEKTGGHHVGLYIRSGRPKCKLPSQMRNIVKATKWYGVKSMNLSAHSIILGNIINTLEMILNHQRATNFIWQCFQGKHWSIPYLAVCGIMVILWPIWGGYTHMIFIQFLGNVILSTYFQKLWKKLGSPGLFRSYSAKRKQQSPLRKIVNTTRRYVQGKKCLTLSWFWIFSFVDTFWNIFQEFYVERRLPALPCVTIHDRGGGQWFIAIPGCSGHKEGFRLCYISVPEANFYRPLHPMHGCLAHTLIRQLGKMAADSDRPSRERFCAFRECRGTCRELVS